MIALTEPVIDEMLTVLDLVDKLGASERWKRLRRAIYNAKSEAAMRDLDADILPMMLRRQAT